MKSHLQLKLTPGCDNKLTLLPLPQDHVDHCMQICVQLYCHRLLLLFFKERITVELGVVQVVLGCFLLLFLVFQLMLP